MLRWIGAWLAAALAAYVLGSVFMTQVVIADLGKLGVAVDAGTRFEMTVRDVAGLSTSWLPLVALAELVALLVATGLVRRFGIPRLGVSMVAGAAATLCLLLIMQQVLGLNPLSGTRGAGGHALQALAGAAGGWLFARFVARSDAARR